MNTKIKKFTLLAGDLVFLHLSLLLTLLIRYGFNDKDFLTANWENHWSKFIVVFAIWILSLYLNGLYDLNVKAGNRRFFRNLGGAEIIAFFLSIIYFYLATSTQITPKTNLIIFFGVFSLLFWLWRSIGKVLFSSIISKDKLLIVGNNNRTQEIKREINNRPGFSYELVSVIESSEEIGNISKIIKDENIKTIVVCDNFGNNEKLREALFNCLNLNLNFFNYPDFYELLTGKIPVEEIDANWFLENIKEGEKTYFNSIKGLIDFIMALIIFIISLPFWPIIALIIKLESRGPIFFKQVRMGKMEREFKILKFRTMRQEGNKQTMTIEGDKRITTFGNILRKTRLDEIPQVINVLRGDMSFIGPRPERPEFIIDLEKQIPFYKTRLLVKPGLSGWDQVSGEYHSPSTEDTLKKLQNDLFYIKNRSLYLDGIIVLKTIAAVLSRSGR